MLDETDQEDLARIADIFSSILLSETRSKEAFIVRENRIPVQKLLTDVSSLMNKDVFVSLPITAQHDFSEAARCLAFELPTACACLLLRGTEAVLRDFYVKLVVTDRIHKLLWGDMVSHLWEQRLTDLKPLLRNLNNIRDSFRNPTLHPEKIYDLDEAQDLFNLCTEVVNRMSKWLKSNPVKE